MKKYVAKLCKDKRAGGWVFNRWSVTGRPLKSIMIDTSKEDAIREIRKEHILLSNQIHSWK